MQEPDFQADDEVAVRLLAGLQTHCNTDASHASHACVSSRVIWTPELHSRFLTAIGLFGRRWTAIAEYLGVTVKSVRGHATRALPRATVTVTERKYARRSQRRPPVQQGIQLEQVKWTLEELVFSDMHTVQLIRTTSIDGTVTVLVHAKHVLVPWVDSDSNVSRTIDRFASPWEKIKVKIPSAHNHTIGQCCNALTIQGVQRVYTQFAERFAKRNADHGESFRQWLLATVIARMQQHLVQST